MNPKAPTGPSKNFRREVALPANMSHIRLVKLGPDVDLSRVAWRVAYDLAVAVFRPSRPPALVALYDGATAGLRPPLLRRPRPQ